MPDLNALERTHTIARVQGTASESGLPTGGHPALTPLQLMQANTQLNARVEACREEIRQLHAKLPRAPVQHTSVEPDVSLYNTDEDEFTSQHTQEHNQSEVNAEDSVSNSGQTPKTGFNVAEYLSSTVKKTDPEAPKYHDILRFLLDFLGLQPKPDSSSTDRFVNRNELLLEATNQGKTEVSSLPPSDTVVHWVDKHNESVRGSGDPLELQQFNLAAHPAALLPGYLVTNEHGVLYPTKAYKTHANVTAQKNLSLDPDFALLGSKEGEVALKPSAVHTFESMLRNSLGILSFMDHTALAVSKLCQAKFSETEQLDSEGQMILNLLKSNAKALNHITALNTALLTNTVLLRRDAFLGNSAVAQDPQLKGFLRSASVQHSTLFANQLSGVAKALGERKRPADRAYFKRPAPPQPKVRRMSSQPRTYDSRPAPSYGHDDRRPQRYDRRGRGQPRKGQQPKSGSRGRGRGQSTKNF